MNIVNRGLLLCRILQPSSVGSVSTKAVDFSKEAKLLMNVISVCVSSLSLLAGAV